MALKLTKMSSSHASKFIHKNNIKKKIVHFFHENMNSTSTEMNTGGNSSLVKAEVQVTYFMKDEIR